MGFSSLSTADLDLLFPEGSSLQECLLAQQSDSTSRKRGNA